MRFEHRRHGIAQSEIGEGDDSGGDARLDRKIASSLSRDIFEKFAFANRIHFSGTVVTIAVTTFDGDRRHDVVAAGEIGEQLIQQVNIGLALPKMMMRIADRQVRLQRSLGRRA